MALLIMVDAATAIQEQTLKRPFPLRISERESDSGFLRFLVLLGKKVRVESDKSSWFSENVRRL